MPVMVRVVVAGAVKVSDPRDMDEDANNEHWYDGDFNVNENDYCDGDANNDEDRKYRDVG